MALIKCPICGKDISDQAKTCIHCGFVLVREKQKVCPECGNELSGNESFCNNCGCPVESVSNIATENIQNNSGKSGKNKKSITKIIIGVAIAVVVIAAAIIAVLTIRKNNEIKQAEIQAEQAEQAKKDYISDLQTISFKMLDGAADAENAGNLIHKVWYNAIFNEYDEESDKYTIENGYFVSDFNDALSNLFSDPDFQEKIEEIRTNQSTIAQLMKNMSSPPEGLEEAYSDLKEYYNAYLEFTNLVTNPTGSLQSFTSSFNDYDAKTLNCYQRMSLYY